MFYFLLSRVTQDWKYLGGLDGGVGGDQGQVGQRDPLRARRKLAVSYVGLKEAQSLKYICFKNRQILVNKTTCHDLAYWMSRSKRTLIQLSKYALTSDSLR